LAKGLSEFKGGIVVVTHDELLIYRLINCNWSASELLICREGTVWRQQNFAADCLKALSKEVRGAEEGSTQATDKKQARETPKQPAASDAKNTSVVTTKEVPPWLQKKPRAKRNQAADVDTPEPAVKSKVEVSSKANEATTNHGADAAVAKQDLLVRPVASTTPGEKANKDTVEKGTAKKKALRNSPGTSSSASKGVQKSEVNPESVNGPERAPMWHAPAVLKHTTRTPVQMPSQHSSWDDELRQLQTLYGSCEVKDGESGQRIVRVTHHCTDPDWEAATWAPAGLQLEVRVGRFYPEPPVEEPTLSVLGPAQLPEKFIKILPLLFAESASKTPARTPAVYRALQYIDKNMVALFQKIRAAAKAAEAAANEQAQRESQEKQSDNAAAASTAVAASESTADCGAVAAPLVQPLVSVSPGSKSVEDVRRMGVEVRLLGLTLEGFSDFLPSLLRVQVVCGRCRKPTDIEAATGIVRNSLPVDSEAAAGIEAACPTCKGMLAVHVAPSSCRGGCQAVAHVFGSDCHPVHLLRSDFESKCSECGEVARMRNIGPGYHKQSKCTGCSTKLNLVVTDVALLGREVEKWQLVAEEEGDRMNSRKQTQEARKMEKGLGIKVGQPLPDKGGCKHYAKAYRWLRFPCCGRAFPCDVCHDEQTDHMHEWATRMLCGLCSQEQPFTKDQCNHCGASQNKSQGGYWEGGDGCRDRSKMAKDDPHKYKGLGKTVPKTK